MFQVFALTLWYFHGGYKFATLILVMLILSFYGEYKDVSENVEQIEKIAHYEWPVRIKRQSNSGQTIYKDTMSGELVPGDVFVVPEKVPLPWDAIIISGEAIVNEAMLTGVSSASKKVEIPDNSQILSKFDINNSSQVF